MSLPCEEVKGAIPWLLDDELDPAHAIEIEAHLQECSSCRAVLEREGRMRVLLRRTAEEVRAPESLRRRVLATLQHERRRQHVAYRVWPAAMAAAVLLSFVWQGSTGALADEDLEEAAVRHARHLPMDVVAGELDQVQRYFDGKLPFAVRVPQFVRNEPVSIQLGGRVVNLSNQDAAYVHYDLPRGRVSLFVYPEARAGSSELAPLYRMGARRMVIRHVRGYSAAKWRANGLVYSVVSDLPEREFSQVLTASFP